MLSRNLFDGYLQSLLTGADLSFSWRRACVGEQREVSLYIFPGAMFESIQVEEKVGIIVLHDLVVLQEQVQG